MPGQAWRFSWLRPSVVGAIVLVLLLGLQACIGSSSGSGVVGRDGMVETTSTRTFGWPTSVTVTRTSGSTGLAQTDVQIRWGTLLVSAAVSYAVATAVGGFITRRRRRRHPANVLLTVIAVTLVLVFAAAMAASWSLWGYALRRPSLDHRIAQARKVFSVTFVKTAETAAGPSLVADPDSSLAARIRYGRTYPYYCLGERALIALEGPQLQAAPALAADRLGRLYSTIAATGRLEAGEPGYAHAKNLRGVVIEAEGTDASPLLFVGVQGGQVSNDHYPYYEFLFSNPGGNGTPRLLSAQRFYFDVAGIEGLEWPLFFLGFSVLGLVVSVPATLLFMAVRPRRVDAALAGVQ